jgi:integrase
MRLEDVDLEHRTVVIPKTKNGRVREVAFSDYTASCLGQYPRMRDRHPRAGLPWLWIGHRGKLGSDGVRSTLGQGRCASQRSFVQARHGPHVDDSRTQSS